MPSNQYSPVLLEEKELGNPGSCPTPIPSMILKSNPPTEESILGAFGAGSGVKMFISFNWHQDPPLCP